MPEQSQDHVRATAAGRAGGRAPAPGRLRGRGHVRPAAGDRPGLRVRRRDPRRPLRQRDVVLGRGPGSARWPSARHHGTCGRGITSSSTAARSVRSRWWTPGMSRSPRSIDTAVEQIGAHAADWSPAACTASSRSAGTTRSPCRCCAPWPRSRAPSRIVHRDRTWTPGTPASTASAPRAAPRFPAARTRRRKLAPPPPRQHGNNQQVRQARCLRLRQLLAGAVNLARFRQALPLGTRQQQRGRIPAGDHARCGYGPTEQRRPGHSLAQRNLLVVRGRRRRCAGDQLPAGMQTPSDGNRRNHCSRRFQHPAAVRLTFTWHRSPWAATKHRGISRRPLRRHLLTAPPRPPRTPPPMINLSCQPSIGRVPSLTGDVIEDARIGPVEVQKARGPPAPSRERRRCRQTRSPQ